MREILELRLSAAKAAQYIPEAVSQNQDPLDTVRLVLDAHDPLVERLRSVEATFWARGETLFTMCEITRRYTPRELQSAERLKVEFWPFFMPSGEECGTAYDDSRACSHCGAGAPQVGALRLKVGRIPKSRDLVITPGAEIVVSARLAGAMQARGITGHGLRPVLDTNDKASADWHQLIIPVKTAEPVAPTRFGKDYLAPEPDSARCPSGHILGMRLLSPIHVSRSSLEAKDWLCTRGLLGLRQGLFRPYPLLLISQRLYRLLKELKVRHLNEEVAHLV